MLATFHPFPTSFWFFLLIVVASIPPAILIGSTSRRLFWRVLGFEAIALILCLGCGVYDFSVGRQWRQGDVYAYKGEADLPWLYSPYWDWIAKTALFALLLSGAATAMIWTAMSVRTIRAKQS
jgi:hypothetical protein